MTSQRGILAIVTALAMGSGADAQVPALPMTAHGDHGAPSSADDRTVRDFLERARAATSRYADPAAALREGFQPVGLETPGMGQHWISAARVFRGEFDVDRPSGLQYATIGGRLTLVGVAWIVPLLDGESPPSFPSVHLWHMHAKTIDEETLLADHNAAPAPSGPRVGVLHAWAWTENPAGPFAPDNWSLPFLRASLRSPPVTAPTVARAVALATDGAPHFTSIIQRYGEPSHGDSIAIASAVSAAASEVRVVLAGVDTELTSVQSAALSAIWMHLWQRIDSVVDPAVRARLEVLKSSTMR